MATRADQLARLFPAQRGIAKPRQLGRLGANESPGLIPMWIVGISLMLHSLQRNQRRGRK